jgi:hypothetical protein
MTSLARRSEVAIEPHASTRVTLLRWRQRRQLPGLLAAIAACAVAVLGVVTPASAYGVGDDPHESTCDVSNPVTLATYHMYDPTDNNRKIGDAYLRYSRGCETQWVTVYFDSNRYTPEPWVWKQNQTGTDRGLSPFSSWGGLSPFWTYQLFNMRTTAGCGGVHIRRYNPNTGATGQYIGWYYLGCK